MKRVSILNNVVGPVMRGPSSSHTAGPWRIARTAADLLGGHVRSATIAFHPSSSLAVCYHDQRSDLAFASGLLRRSLTDSDFGDALRLAPGEGLDIRFEARPFPEADHPNSALLELTGERGGKIVLHSRSTGGGSFEIASLDGYPVRITGESFEVLVQCDGDAAPAVLELLERSMASSSRTDGPEGALCRGSSATPPSEAMVRSLRSHEGVRRVLRSDPVMFPLKGRAICRSMDELAAFAYAEGLSLGRAGLACEAALLGMSEDETMRAMDGYLDVMLGSVALGLSDDLPPMRLLRPMAASIHEAERSGRLFTGGPHARAAIRALAAMHASSAGGVVCAAPTGGSAGVLPGVAATLLEDMGRSREEVLLALWAAGAVGWGHDTESTFAAEVAGCQVEIGMAGAMGAAAVTEAGGGTAGQACDAAAIVLQNVMGSVCDLVQGVVEVPCHSRNAALASQALLCADLILGGFENPVPLGETIQAVDSVGRMLPEELRCTSRGGLALCPSALRMKKLQ